MLSCPACNLYVHFMTMYTCIGNACHCVLVCVVLSNNVYFNYKPDIGLLLLLLLSMLPESRAESFEAILIVRRRQVEAAA